MDTSKPPRASVAATPADRPRGALAVAFASPGVSDPRIDVACMRASIANLATVGIVSTVLGSLSVWAMRARVSDGWLTAWLMILVATTLPRVVFGRRFHARPRTDDEVRAFLPIYSAAMIAGGVVWGSLIAATGFSRDPFVVMILLLNIAGMIAGGTASTVMTPRTFAAMTVLSIGPICVHLARSGETALEVVVGFTLTFLAAMTSSSVYNLRTFRESIRLRFENLELLDRLRSERDRAEVARAEAEDAAADKARFLAAASHDVRQPLHALGLFLEALKAEPLSPPTQSLVHRIDRTSGAIRALLDGLLDVSKLDARVWVPRPRVFSVATLFDAIEVEAQPRAEELGLSLRVRPTTSAVRSDPELVLRIVRNLVANALRYTTRGGVLVAARRRGDRVRIAVFDTGLGIEPSAQERIFDELARHHEDPREGGEGLGLGLSIARRMARLLDTDVALRSVPGRGSVFWIDLPRAEEAPPVASTTRLRGDGRLVVVVDDDELARVALARLLEAHGFEVVTATSAEEARDYLATLDRPFAVISDHRLPGESGRSLLDHVRASAPEVRVVLITGDTATLDVRALHESGLPVLYKPVAPARLAEHLSE
jgi:signal transduction histidine kinase/CheY-like chemotaxis protein